MRIALIDNYDSFSFNLLQLVRTLVPGCDLQVWRNDQVDLAQLEQFNAQAFIISPGPGTPDDAGISLKIIKHFAGRAAILGVCLGHQVIAQSFGAKIERAKEPLHGRLSIISHNQTGIFSGIPCECTFARYHSLIVAAHSLPDELLVTSWSNAHEIMSLQHKTHKIFGVQFHPESFLSVWGEQLMRNFLELSSPN